jgi:hypothetical protein
MYEGHFKGDRMNGFGKYVVKRDEGVTTYEGEFLDN